MWIQRKVNVNIETLVQIKCGSLAISALAFSARGHGFDPRGRRKNILVSEYAFLSVICNLVSLI